MKQKQILSLLTAAALVTSGAVSAWNPAPALAAPVTVSAAEIAAASDFVGTWQLYKQILDGEEYTREQIGPDAYYYVFNQDGTGESITIFSQEGLPDDSYMAPMEMPFTWKSSGSKVTITFQRDDPDMPAFEPTVMTLKNGVLI
ncbi:MAG: lipocalin family protein [Oscillospiraceae bacterium]|nr:lipocalin family protein [Oscillospiraceae bacterium]